MLKKNFNLDRRSIFPNCFFLGLVRILPCLLSLLLIQPGWSQLALFQKFRYRCLTSTDTIENLYATQSTIPQQNLASPDSSAPPPPPLPADFSETNLQLFEGYRSDFYTCDRSKPLQIIRHQGNRVLILATVKFTDFVDVKVPLLIISQRDPDKISIQVLDDDPKKYPGGSFEIINKSRHPVTVSFETEKEPMTALMALNDVKIFNPTKEDLTSRTLTLWLPGGVHPVYSSVWNLQKRVRYLFFIKDDPSNPNSVVLRTIPEDLEVVNHRPGLFESP